MTPKEAVEMVLLALFGEKYGDEVREFLWEKKIMVFFNRIMWRNTCKNTKEIGKFKIISQSSIASGVRRVEALRDKQLEEYEKNQKKINLLKRKI
jgi:alanyl-tRNA synthetase